MLNNLNVTALLKSEFASHVDRLAKRVDSNGDGHLSKTEFSEFLADVVRKLELAEEFRQIGDMEGARDLLEEVVAKANGSLKAKAQGMLETLA